MKMNLKMLPLILALMFSSILLSSCAAPRGDAAKQYDQSIYIYCSAPSCNVSVTVATSVDADVKKDQQADAKADISPTVDLAP
ncbi:hypothetical protein LCGC14_2231530 [marine sediment metagenome]|uniref:Uncharacterized protein n=1 Tax=marine sediment metagenome TaxID=412755 RepID=A0A0F9D8D3_9ZZZZ